MNSETYWFLLGILSGVLSTVTWVSVKSKEYVIVFEKEVEE